MKIPIIDLMDYYSDHSVKLDIPEFPAEPHVEATAAPAQRKKHSMRKPMLAVASLILIVTGALYMQLSFHRSTDSGQALNETPAATESFGVSAEIPVDSSRESDEIAVVAEPKCISTTIEPMLVSGQMDERSLYCEGNMFSVDGQYYTMTENGLEPLQPENLHTTVDLYGSWEVDIDYAVVDGVLAFHNNVSTQSYAIYNGEILTQQEYHDGGMSAVFGELTWIEPAVAYALPLEDSPNTVILRIFRQDKPAYERVAYTFLYNIFTGEISDPLANVPELFDHGYFCYATFNTSVTRAIVRTYETDGYNIYVCDLISGEMVNLYTLAEGSTPTSDNPDTVFTTRTDNCIWADDDTLLYWVMESTPNGNEAGYTETGDYISDSDDCYWLCSYDMSTRLLNYQKRDAEFYLASTDGTYTYIQDISAETATPYVLNTADGSCSYLDITVNDFNWDTTENQMIIFEGGTLYLVDCSNSAWTTLNDALELPESWNQVLLLADNKLVLIGDDAVYCYMIPEGLAWEPMV